MNWNNCYKKAVTLSYDDGNEQDVKLLEILNTYGIKATFNVNTGLNYNYGVWKYKESLSVHRLNLWECPSLYQGHEIAVHGSKHLNLTQLNREEIRTELISDLTTIEEIYGERPAGMAYAYGAYNSEVLEEVSAAGLYYGRGVVSNHAFSEQSDLLCFQPTCHHDDPLLFQLVNEFLRMKSEKPQIFYLWGHSYEFEGNHNWDRILRFCELIGRRNDIFYGTNRQVLLKEPIK